MDHYTRWGIARDDVAVSIYGISMELIAVSIVWGCIVVTRARRHPSLPTTNSLVLLSDISHSEGITLPTWSRLSQPVMLLAVFTNAHHWTILSHFECQQSVFLATASILWGVQASCVMGTRQCYPGSIADGALSWICERVDVKNTANSPIRVLY
jgi:hypothetical protein